MSLGQNCAEVCLEMSLGQNCAEVCLEMSLDQNCAELCRGMSPEVWTEGELAFFIVTPPEYYSHKQYIYIYSAAAAATRLAWRAIHVSMIII